MVKKMNEVKHYKLSVENLDLIRGREGEILFETTIQTAKSVLNYFTPVSKVAELLKNHNIEVPEGILLGHIIEFSDDEDTLQYVTIGHEGDESGNIKTVRQLDIYWEEVAF